MSDYKNKARECRKAEHKHYNCAQSVLLAFSDSLGLDEETAYKIASGFGSGMKSGNVCGAITGGIMVLGLMGLDSPSNIQYLFKKVKDNHDGRSNCRDLLELNRMQNGNQNQHCDNMVYEVIDIIGEIKSLN